MFEAVSDFINRGGDVLIVIFIVTMAMWTLILERQYYFRVSYPPVAKVILKRWHDRSDQISWRARQIRSLWISEASAELNRSISLINTLVALCPLLGLLGTVTGMIEVFDVMATAGNSNARAMAAGVSKATIPTMAGMVAALSGLYFSVQLQRFAKDQGEKLADQMTHD
ncbi:MAG: biopolymer transporter ExbB [Deltaproteobacteria bacterium]|jgi:biopolymer transport protein ExbB|nr:biopolymer transporter ExbB [Deltaproteobacteria bacterium]